MLTEELENMTPAENQGRTWNGAKAVVALFPYAVRQQWNGDNRMLDACSAVTRDQRRRESMAQPIVALLDEEDFDFPDWVVTLVSPYAQWGFASTNAVTRWAEAALAVPYTEEVGQMVVDTLLQIAYYEDEDEDSLQSFIPVDIWAWLKKRPSLPPTCRGRDLGTVGWVVRRVRELGDVELLESLFLLVWSEWNSINGPEGMRASIREDFCGIGMWRHREALIKRLDHVLGELGKGFEHLKQQKPSLDKDHIRLARKDYGELQEVLLQVDREALEILTRMPFIYLFDLLTRTDVHRIPLNIHLCSPPPMSVVARPQRSLLALPTPYFIRASVTSVTPSAPSLSNSLNMRVSRYPHT